MRYPEDRIKEALLHPDLDARDAAISYFYDSRPDHTLMPMGIAAIEKYGRTGAFSYTHHLNLLPQTEQTLDWVIAELNRDFEAPAEEKYFYYLNLSRLLWHADIRLVAEAPAAILETAHYEPKERVSFRERLEMAEWDADTCWKALQRFCESSDGKYLEEINLGHALRVVEALGRQAQLDQEKIVAILSEPAPDRDNAGHTWMQSMAANLAGEIRLRAAVPLLVRNLNPSRGFLSDQSMFALARIGGDEVVSVVCDLFPGASNHFRLYAGDLLGKIHLDLAVQRMLEFVPAETDLAVRTSLCLALIEQFTVECVDPARQLVLEHSELSPELRQVRSSLVTVCKVIGHTFPEFATWQERAGEDERRVKASVREMNKLVYESGGDILALVRKIKASRNSKQVGSPGGSAPVRLGSSRPPSRLPGHVAGAFSKKAKVGRNDACPCGSGRKFKHCCLKA